MVEQRSGAKIRRRMYLIDKKFQFKYLGILCAVGLCMSLVCGGGTYLLFRRAIYHVLAKYMPQIWCNEVITSEVMRTANIYIWVMLPVCILVIGVLSIFLSHRIAGPEFRLRRTLKGMSSGDYRDSIKLRKNDDLKYLAADINQLALSLSQSMLKFKNITEVLMRDIEIIKKKVETKGLDIVAMDEHLKQLVSTVEEFKSAVADYKLEDNIAKRG